MKPLVATAPGRGRDWSPRCATPAPASRSTPRPPGYRAAFDHLGLGELADEAKVLSKAQRWEELPPLIDDDVLHTFVTVGTYDEIADRLHDRFGDVVDPLRVLRRRRRRDDRDALAAMVAALHAATKPPPGRRSPADPPVLH